MSFFHELVLFWESETVNAEKSPTENANWGDTICLIHSCVSLIGMTMNTTIYLNMKSLKMPKKCFNTKLNAHGGFTPAAVASPNAIPPEQVKYDNPRTR